MSSTGDDKNNRDKFLQELKEKLAERQRRFGREVEKPTSKAAAGASKPADTSKPADASASAQKQKLNVTATSPQAQQGQQLNVTTEPATPDAAKKLAVSAPGEDDKKKKDKQKDKSGNEPDQFKWDWFHIFQFFGLKISKLTSEIALKPIKAIPLIKGIGTIVQGAGKVVAGAVVAPLKSAAGVVGAVAGGLGWAAGNIASKISGGRVGSDFAAKSKSVAIEGAKWAVSPLAVVPGIAGGAVYGLGKVFSSSRLTEAGSNLVERAKEFGGFPVSNMLGGIGNIVEGGIGVVKSPWGKTIAEHEDQYNVNESFTTRLPQEKPQPGHKPQPGKQPQLQPDLQQPGSQPQPQPGTGAQPSQLQDLNEAAANRKRSGSQVQQGQAGSGGAPLTPSKDSQQPQPLTQPQSQTQPTPTPTPKESPTTKKPRA